MRTAAEQLTPFYKTCMEAMEPGEHRLFRWLARKGTPANPKEAAQGLKVGSVKQTADCLCYLGLISRWNLENGAKLHATCRLFNEWYLAAQRG